MWLLTRFTKIFIHQNRLLLSDSRVNSSVRLSLLRYWKTLKHPVRRVAHIGSKVRTNHPSFAKFRFFSCSLYECASLVITRRLSSSNKEIGWMGVFGTVNVCTKAVLWASARARLRCDLWRPPLPGFSLSRGRSGNQPEPNPFLLVHLSRFESLRPRKSRQVVRSKKNNAFEVNLWLRPFYSRVRHLTCKERCGRGPGVSDSIWQARILKNGYGAIDRSFAHPEALSERLPATVPGIMAGRVPMAYVLRIGGRRFQCVPCALFHKSRGQDVGQLITKPMTNWTKISTTQKEHAVSKTHRESVNFNNPEGARCQQNAQRVYVC